MQTKPLIATLVLAAALTAGCTVNTADARHIAARSSSTTFSPQEIRSLGDLPAVAPAYNWPLKPFDRQHPVRAFFDDPRIGHEGGRAFHFGIDVAAPDGTRVYAVTGGILYLAHGSLAVVAGGGHEYGYWHVVRDPGLREHQIVHRHQLLGTIAAGWGHVHFAERVGGIYVNPLRPGALGPYTDPVAPTVGSVTATTHPDGTVSLVVLAHDTTWPRVPGSWANEPVTPSLLRWRLTPAGRPSGHWKTAADFRMRMLDRSAFGAVYAPETTQNHEERPGTYGFFLAHDWHPADGDYRIDVAAFDTRGNSAVATFHVVVTDATVR